jgi:hypothetical protein
MGEADLKTTEQTERACSGLDNLEVSKCHSDLLLNAEYSTQIPKP